MEDKKRILIVDDEKGFTSMLSLNLEVLGEYDVRVENNPLRAVETALQFKPNIILLDVIMPHREGPDVARELKSHDGLKNVPVIFLTATITKDEMEDQDGRIAGHLFVAKPSSFSDLLESIKRPDTRRRRRRKRSVHAKYTSISSPAATQ